MSESKGYEGWAILELMGHRRLAGKISEAVIGGAAMTRIDVPRGDGFSTQFYGASALYCVTPTTEEIARRLAESTQPQPVHRWELPAPEDPVVNVGSPSDFDDPGGLDPDDTSNDDVGF